MSELFDDFGYELNQVIVSGYHASGKRMLVRVAHGLPIPLDNSERVGTEVVTDQVFPAGLRSRPLPDSIGVLAGKGYDARLGDGLTDSEVQRQANVALRR